MVNGNDDVQLVMVVWRDAFFDFDEPDEGEQRSDYLVRTVGFLVGEDEKFVHVAQELLPDGDGHRAVTHIPIPVRVAQTPLMVVQNLPVSLPPG